MMLASFPASASRGDLVARAYLLAVEGLTDISVQKAAKEFITGTVTGHDTRFAPSTAQFSARVRLHDEIGERAARQIQKHPEKIEELSPEHRAEMRRRIAGLNPGLRRISAGDPDGEAA